MRFVSKPTGYTPLLSKPDTKSVKVRDLNPKTVVEVIEECPPFAFVQYGEHQGYVEARYLDDYPEPLDKDCVYLADIATPDPKDAAQFVLWNKVRQVNFCGELCIAYLLGYDLSYVLTMWEANNPKVYKRIFGEGMASGTNKVDLCDIFACLNVTAKTFGDKEYSYWTPDLVKELKNAIVSVHIDKLTGDLNGSGILHWVVIVDCWRNRTGGTVDIYNPYQNRIERYSYTEFANSARQPFGVRL